MTTRRSASSPKTYPLAGHVEIEVRRFLAGAILFNQKVAEEVGLNATDLQCLHFMQLEGCNRPKDLARCCGLTTGGMTVVLDRLEKAGYIKREPNPDDRRSLLIRGIPAKTRKLEAIYRSKGELLAGVVSRYNEGELELILDFFTRCNRSNSSPE